MLRNISTRLAASKPSCLTYNHHVPSVQRMFVSSAAAPPPPPPSTSTDAHHQPERSAPVALSEAFAHLRLHSAADGHYWRSHYGQIAVPDMTLDEYVWKNVAKWPNKIAIVCGITGRKYTYARLRDHSAAVAQRLRTEYGLKPGDVLAISMPNVPEYAIVALGALEAGLILTTVNPAYTAGEHARQLDATEPKLIVGLVESVPTLLDAARERQRSVPIVAVRTHASQTLPEGIRDFAELMDLNDIDMSASGAPKPRPDDVCVLPFSSGTTGLPKGVQLTHNNIAANCEMMDMPLPDHRMMLPTTNDYQEVLPCVLPFYHVYGFTFLLMSKLALGCKIVTLPRFDPVTYVTALAEHKATFLAVVPPLLLFLANDERVTGRHLYSVRRMICGAAASAECDVNRMQEKARSIKFMQGYGMTETAPVTHLSTLPNVNYNSIGRPVASTEAKIVRLGATDKDGAELGLEAHEEGELLVRGPQVMRGYLNDVPATEALMAPGGWMRTGDVAAYDEAGLFYLRDRVKEVMKVAGFQVAPVELEEVLRSHPLVLDAGVIGVPHERYGEVPRAFVAVRERIDSKELEAYVAKRVTKYKRLVGGVQLVDEVPRSATGKILRRELKRLYL